MKIITAIISILIGWALTDIAVKIWQFEHAPVTNAKDVSIIPAKTVRELYEAGKLVASETPMHACFWALLNCDGFVLAPCDWNHDFNDKNNYTFIYGVNCKEQPTDAK